jgi:hypothetical protein
VTTATERPTNHERHAVRGYESLDVVESARSRNSEQVDDLNGLVHHSIQVREIYWLPGHTQLSASHRPQGDGAGDVCVGELVGNYCLRAAWRVRVDPEFAVKFGMGDCGGCDR